MATLHADTLKCRLNRLDMRLKITGIGLHVPPRVETAADLAPRIGRSEQWILSRTGVAERRVSDEDMAVMGARAAMEALGDGPPPDLILNASGVARQTLPDSSVYIQDAMGMEGIPSHSVAATCLSFLVALHTAGAFLEAGAYQRILIVSADRGTRGRNYDEPESAALLGDGAAAVVVERTPRGEGSALINWKMTTWPKGAHLTEVRGGGTRLHPNDPETTPADNLFSMSGPRVYKMARRKVYAMIDEILQERELTREDITRVIPHQASGFAVSAYHRFGGFTEEQVVDVIAEYGNCVAAGLPMALATAWKRGQFDRGDKILMMGTGAGLSVAGALLVF